MPDAMSSSNFSAGAAYINGKYVPIAEATIPVTDWALTRSDVVYDVVHVHRGSFFKLQEHLNRFANSMRARRLVVPESSEQIEAILHRVVDLSELAESYVAMVALRGRPRVAGSRRPQDCDNYLIAYAIPWVDVISKSVQARGARLWISSNPRVPDASVDPTVKNYQWSDLTTGLFEAIDNGYDTSVLCDAQGLVTEGPGFNIFAVVRGSVYTPDHGALKGITRATVFELCAAAGIPCEEIALTRATLESADEVFVTTTAGGVMNIGEISGRLLHKGEGGPIFVRLNRAYWASHESGPYVTPVRHVAGTREQPRISGENNV